MGKSKVNAKKNQTNRAVAIGGSIVAVVFALCLVLALVVNTGAVDRSKTVMSSENYKINGVMLKYYFKLQYNNFLNSYGNLAQYMGLNTAAPLKSQTCSFDKDKTWFEYFMDSTTAQLETSLVYCEAAKSAGVSLEKEDYDAIDEAVASLESAAKESGYTLNGYVSALFGNGVRVKDVRDALEITQLYVKYAKIKNEEVKTSAVDEDIKKYFDEHITDFLVASYISKSWTATSGVGAIENKKADYKDDAKYEEDLNNAKKDYADAKAKYDGYVETLKACKDVEEFKAALKKIFYDEKVDSEMSEDSFKKALDKYKKDNSVPADDEKALADAEAAVKGQIMKDAEKYADDEVEKAVFEKVSFNNTEALGKFVFGTELSKKSDEEDKKDDNKDKEEKVPAAKVNDIFTDKTSKEDEEKNGKYTVTVAIVTEESAKDTSPTKYVGHILVSVAENAKDEEKKKAKEEAEKILAEYEKGEKTKDSFEELAKKYTADGSVFYEGVKEGDMVGNFNDWLFELGDYKDDSKKRFEGETAIVETKYGYHIMYFVGEGKEAWFEDSRKAYVNSEIEKWEEEFAKKCNIKKDEKKINGLSL